MAGITSNGIMLYWGTATASNSIGKLTSVSGPESEAAEIDCTTMDDAVAIYLPGIPSPGTISFSGNYDPAKYGTLNTALMAKTTSAVNMVFSDGSDFAANGFLTRLGTTSDLNGPVKIDGTIRLSGALTHVTS